MHIKSELTYGDGDDITITILHGKNDDLTPWCGEFKTFFGVKRDVARQLAMDLLNLVDKYDRDMYYLMANSLANFETRLQSIEEKS